MTLETHEIRRFGIRLNEACARFASDDLLEELETANQPLTPPDIDAEKPIVSIAKAVLFFGQMPQLQKAKERQQTQIRDALREHLRFWLETGELMGCGNQVLPTPTRVPRKIQPDFWQQAEIDWDHEIARDAHRTYQRILVIDPEDFPGRELFPAMGPKYFSYEIREAMIELENQLPKFKTSEMAHKVRAIEVRNLIKANYPKININGRGFDVDTIRRHYKRHCISSAL